MIGKLVQTLRSSGLVSNEPNHKQYLVPMDWIEKESGRKDSIELAGSSAATEEDRKTWYSIPDFSLTSSSFGQIVPLMVPVKQV